MINHHGSDLQQLRSLLQELLAASPAADETTEAGRTLAAEASDVDAELAAGRADRGRILDLLDRITGSVGGAAAAGTAAVQLATALGAG
ncbi:hypothetical protein [Streptomyces sp. NPDC096132]|uniref:hypothetical protein n=1 Tax=Streptomyces sp. NPDC096132 TaxID=3366075 RepID=UPI0037F5E225